MGPRTPRLCAWGTRRLGHTARPSGHRRARVGVLGSTCASASVRAHPRRLDLQPSGQVTSWNPTGNGLLQDLGVSLDLPDTSLNNPETYTYDPEGRVSTATTSDTIAGLIGLTATTTTYGYDADSD